MTKTAKTKATKEEALMCNTFMNNLPLSVIPKDIIKPFLSLKKEVGKISDKYAEDELIIRLTCGGKEETDPRGQKFIELPTYPTRENFKGSDEEYNFRIQTIQKDRDKYYASVEKKVSETIELSSPPFVTDEMFDGFCFANTKNDKVEYEQLRKLFVIPKP